MWQGPYRKADVESGANVKWSCAYHHTQSSPLKVLTLNPSPAFIFSHLLSSISLTVVLFVGGSPTPQATIHLKIRTETAQRETVRDILDLHFEGLCRETWPLSHQVLRTGIFMA
ncbi:hypothetical protein LOK49_LG11G01338 [Camellia lanceoleosa]|uniref:Uncharacterized protein n=1 Tax=Camellia lanceoleosa TaxID=1840588 RepID=A0ACC0G566_9ERIC|nr:hypothetical protein LOK49_LG11G01338 [Camellia lanceoleosa]